MSIYRGRSCRSQPSSEKQLAAGVAPGYVRLFVGIEPIDDILDDLRQAIEKATKGLALSPFSNRLFTGSNRSLSSEGLRMDRLDVLKRWLRDGYAMEHQSIQVFKRDAERIVNYPELANIIQNSIALSETHAQMLQRCLNSLGGGPSVVKTTFGAAMGNIQVLIGALAADEAVKVAMFSYVHEHYKIGAYAVLVAAAEECNQPEIAKECSDALRREEGVQRELLAQINRVTRTYLTRTASGDASAKR